MILDTIKRAVGPKVGRALLTGKSYSPELYLAGGLVMGIGSAIMLAKAHKKSEEVLDPIIETIEETKDYIAGENMTAVKETGHEEISRAEATNIMKPLYGALVLDAVKLYGPGVLMGVGSIALIMASHGVLRNRNRALISTVALIERGFSTYRKRVIGEFGKDVDEKLFYGADSRAVVSTRNHIPEVPVALLYGRTFDDKTPRWTSNRKRNETWLWMIQSMMNDKLDLYGVVFLNDVYEQLGFRKTAVGAVSGWCKELDGGDNFVSFGLDEPINLNQGDNRWMLNFNVQGNILDGVGNEEAPELY